MILAEGPTQKPTELKTGRKAKVLMILVSLVFSLVVAEVGLRVLGYSYPVFYAPDENRGYALRPGMQGWYRKEGESWVRINSDGLRDREHDKAKPGSAFRIAVLGDSYAEALQVPMERAYWYLMEQKLNECGAFGGKKIEVVNFGVSGYGTAQELITLERKVWEYQPDLVLLSVTTNNDVTDNLRELKKTDEIPYFLLNNGQLVPDNSFRETKSFRARSSSVSRVGAWFRDRLRIIQAVHQAQVGIKTWIASMKAHKITTPAETHTAAVDVNTPAEELGIDNLVYRTPNDPLWTRSWEVTEALLLRMNDEIRAKRAKFLVVTLSNGIQVVPNSAFRAEFMKRLGVDTLFYPDLRIKAFGDRNGFEVINLAPALQQYADENKVYLHGFGKQLGNGHWNELGHRVAGEMIAEKLCEQKPQ
jgi:lysophospholipase L1-like esterase